MATRYDRIPALEVVGEVTAQVLLDLLNPIIGEINAVLAELGTAEAETRGDDGRTPQFRADIDMNRKRITNAERSRDPYDVVVRQELMDIGLIGDPRGATLNNVTLGTNVTVSGAGGGSAQIATSDDVAEAVVQATGAIPVAVEGQRIVGRDYGTQGTTEGTLLLIRNGDNRAEFVRGDNGRILLESEGTNELLAQVLEQLVILNRRLGNGVDD